jgi:hypothetical protein
VKKIYLSVRRYASSKFALVDDEDYEYLRQWKWNFVATANGRTCYAVRGTKEPNGKQTSMFMHVVLLGKKEGYVTDHIDGNGLNNQRSNLRHVTVRQNAQNKHTARSSKYPGVSLCKANGKWIAGVVIKGESKFLGSFSTELEAYQAYCKALAEIGETPLPLTNQ